MSTTQSDEDYPGSGSTLSFHIPVFDLSWPDIGLMALNTRLNGLITGLNVTAGPKVVA